MDSASQVDPWPRFWKLAFRCFCLQVVLILWILSPFLLWSVAPNYAWAWLALTVISGGAARSWKRIRPNVTGKPRGLGKVFLGPVIYANELPPESPSAAKVTARARRIMMMGANLWVLYALAQITVFLMLSAQWGFLWAGLLVVAGLGYWLLKQIGKAVSGSSLKKERLGDVTGYVDRMGKSAGETVTLHVGSFAKKIEYNLARVEGIHTLEFRFDTPSERDWKLDALEFFRERGIEVKSAYSSPGGGEEILCWEVPGEGLEELVDAFGTDCCQIDPEEVLGISFSDSSEPECDSYG